MAFILLALATWRVSSLLVHEDGPFEMFLRLRYAAGIRYDDLSQPYATTFLGELLLCLWCASVWVGFAFAMLYLFAPPLVWQIPAWSLALSALAIFIQKFHEEGWPTPASEEAS